jgi:hypothetical protein
MSIAMVDVYFKLVKSGSRTIESVPENLRADVQAKIDAQQATPQTEEQPVQ